LQGGAEALRTEILAALGARELVIASEHALAAAALPTAAARSLRPYAHRAGNARGLGPCYCGRSHTSVRHANSLGTLNLITLATRGSAAFASGSTGV
jgi:hypothetical protein